MNAPDRQRAMGLEESALSPRLTQWQQGGHVFRARGHHLFYKDQGRGSAVLLLHGYPTGSFDWHAVWQPLMANHRLIAPDFLGLGFSDKPLDFDYTLAAHAQAVDSLLASLGVAEVHVVAHDLGVRVAQEMLARREVSSDLTRVRSLVLLNGAMCPDAYRPRVIQRLLASPLGPWLGPRIPRTSFDRAIKGLFGASTPPAQDLLDDFWSLVEHGDGRRVTHAVGRFWAPGSDMRDRLVGALLRSPAPLRIINGSADPNSGEHMVRSWFRLAPHTDVIRFEAIGHRPHIEHAQATTAAILDFWNRS